MADEYGPTDALGMIEAAGQAPKSVREGRRVGLGGGRIINVSARAALEGKGRMGPYCASKAAVKTLTESLAAKMNEALERFSESFVPSQD